jgi:hypothetical protein
MSRLEILHHIARLQRPGLGHGAGHEVDQDARLVGLRDDKGKEELGQLADARHGVQVGLAQGAHAHDAQHEGHEDGRDGGVERDEVAEDDVDAEDAEGDGEDQADDDEAVADLLVGGRVVFLFLLFHFPVWRCADSAVR